MDSKKDVWGLVCHHFLQYNAVLSGGQFLGGIVADRAKSGLAPPPQVSSVGSSSGNTIRGNRDHSSERKMAL